MFKKFTNTYFADSFLPISCLIAIKEGINLFNTNTFTVYTP